MHWTGRLVHIGEGYPGREEVGFIGIDATEVAIPVPTEDRAVRCGRGRLVVNLPPPDPNSFRTRDLG